MTRDEFVVEAVTKSPLLLLTITDIETIKKVDYYLPYSTGFEIECDKGVDYDDKYFESIPDIIEVSNDSGEQRYRIPAGIKGLICLYNICEQLIQHSKLNKGSGIHYHVDCTDISKYRTSPKVFREKIRSQDDWILSELSTWENPGDYNSKEIGFGFNWVRLNTSFYTMEFRIGDQSFDYKHLVKRIIHCNYIVRTLKAYLNRTYNYNISLECKPVIPNSEEILKFIKQNSVTTKSKIDDIVNELRLLNSDEIPLRVANNAIKNRIIKC